MVLSGLVGLLLLSTLIVLNSIIEKRSWAAQQTAYMNNNIQVAKLALIQCYNYYNY